MSNPEKRRSHSNRSASSAQVQKRQTLSEPARQNSLNIIPPLLTITGKHNNSNITVYGEIHNMIDNRFYESLKLDNKIIMVEHATVLCEISDVHKRTLLNVAKGSDWIWYKYKSRKRPIICIDNRIELGLLSSIEERYLLNTEDNEDLATILSYVLKAVAVFAKKEIKALFLTPELKEIYKHAMEVIQRQSSILYHVGDLEERYMLEIKDMLIQNITKLSSLIVDINIYNTIIGLGAAAQDIVLFVGAAHAHRLHKYFRDIFTNIGPNPLSAEDIKTLDKMVYENERVETAIINVLR